MEGSWRKERVDKFLILRWNVKKLLVIFCVSLEHGELQLEMLFVRAVIT